MSDLRDSAVLAGAMQGVETVVHAAALMRSKDPTDFDAVNVQGTRSLLDVAQAARVPRFIYVSSLEATLPVLTAYARSKRDADRVVMESRSNTVILRPTVLYGPGDKESLGTLFRIVKKFLFAPRSLDVGLRSVYPSTS